MNICINHPDREVEAKGLCSSCRRKAQVAAGTHDWKGRRLDPYDREQRESELKAKAAVDPFIAAREQRAAQRDDSQARAALKSALGRIEVLESQLSVLTAPAVTPLAPVPMLELTRGSRHACAIPMLSDVHAGARVVPSESTYWNCYSPAICEYRVQRWFAGVEWLVNSYRDGTGDYAWNIREMVAVALGDIVDGHLHEDNIETSDTAIKTIAWLEPVLIAGFERLAKLKFDRFILDWNYGNHGRDSKRPQRGTGADHSHEWGLGVRLARYLKSAGIEVRCPAKPHHYLEVYGRTLHTHHGDEIQYAGGVGGISIPINKAVNQWNRVKHADYHMFGHYHQQLDHGDWFANGSVVGYNDFAMSIKATPEPPQQTFFLLDAKRGKTSVSPIWVSDAEGEKDIP